MDASPPFEAGVWRTLARDIGILLALMSLTGFFISQTDGRRPPFTWDQFYVVTGAIASFDTVSVPERAAAPRINSTTFCSRTAFRLEG